MMNKLDKFIDKLSTKYQKNLTKNEIKTIIGYDSALEDMPIATGKRLVVKYMKITGEKKNGDAIDFETEFEEGINIIIADNLKGKSSVFKVLKTALVGDAKSIKADVKEWIKNIIVGFKISDKDYTIEISMEKRFKGALYNILWSKFLDADSKCDSIVFEANDNKRYSEEIQKFFFNQFSYYSLKWTQKSSAKDSNELLEAGASWKTYYKSIYLESKDSASFYGGQDQKVFQMLLGLENTYLINHLNVKKDMLQFEIGKHKDYEGRNLDTDSVAKKEVEERLEQVKKELEQIKSRNDVLELFQLQKDHNKILEKINNKNKEILELTKSYKGSTVKQRDILRKVEEYESEERRIRREITKNKKLLIDLKEYIEIGQFFSNLDIKYCPSCNHEIHNETSIVHGDTCPLCREMVKKDEENKQSYILKISELEVLLQKLEGEKVLLEEKIRRLKEELENINNEVSSISNKTELLEKSSMEEKLANIHSRINQISESNSGNYEKEKSLIAEQAVLFYKKDIISNINSNKLNIEKLQDELNLLIEVIEFLDDRRYEKSKNILDTLASIMLNEIHEFGLKSITDIKIDNKFNITYVQNDLAMKFDDIAEGEQLRAKLAFYLGLIQMDIEKNFGRHTRFLIIDSPNKEEGDSTYLDGLKEVLLNINKRYGSNLQIIIGTATRELEDVVKNQLVYLKGDYVF
jgi:predicted RNA-binding Zn-ribbon protein involved in translation (DUF1610 family)